MRLTNKFLFILIFLLLLFTIPCNAATYYMATTGGDAGHTGATDDPWLTLQYAFSEMSSGDTLIIRDGTYTGASNMLTTAAYPPLGGDGTPTVIRAENSGSVIIDGEGARTPIWFEPGSPTDVYWEFRGIIFKDSSAQVAYMVRTSYISFFECAFVNAAIASDAFATHTCSYFLLEDCYSWGSCRYHFHYYVTDYSIFRRCVVRHDRGNAIYQNGFQVYGSQYVAVQNCIVIDSDQDSYYNSPDQLHAFKIPQASSGDISFNGCIALNGPGMSMSWVQADDSTWKNSAGWGLEQGVTTRSSGSVTWDHMTLGNIGQYGTNGDGATKTMTNSVIYDCTTYGLFDWGGTFTSNYNSLYANGADFNSVTDGEHDLCAANSNAIDPIDGTPGNGTTALKYLTRIEDSSDLDGVASDSGDIGATILKQFGTSGTIWGEEGYNTITETDLWPFPNEDLIKTKMAAYTYDDGGGGDPEITGARGFCTGTSIGGDPQTLTTYIWEYLGNEIPSGIYGAESSTITTNASGTFTIK